MPNHDKLTLTTIVGTPAAAGRAYGQAFERQIMGFCRQELRPNKDRLALAARCWPSIEEQTPTAAAFLRGMAAGAHLSLDHAVLLQLHEEVCHQPHCTAFAVTGDATHRGRTIIAQNWDWSPAMYPWPGLLRLKMARRPRLLSYHYPGLPVGAGINEHGLSLMWTSSGLNPAVAPRAGVPTYALIFELLLRDTVASALDFLHSTRRAGAFTFLLADAAGDIAAVEAIPTRLAVQRGGSHACALCRGNHNLCPDIIRAARQLTPDPAKGTTTLRTRKMNALLRKHHGNITPEVGRQILTDRRGPWPWLSQYPAARDAGPLSALTIDSLLADCIARTLWTSRGGRERGPWQSVKI